LQKHIGADELAITFEALQRIERRASRLLKARTFPEAK